MSNPTYKTGKPRGPTPGMFDGLQEEIRPLLERRENARTNMIETLMERGDLTAAEAELVFDLYRSPSIKAIKPDFAIGRYKVTNGGFMDKEVIRRALAAAKEGE